ncbi:hypothetical protein BBP40_011989 [Aspergillus hancockii]|nr:hypothetical protein BBP40_011989 [Aspergillus hancockii]
MDILCMLLWGRRIYHRQHAPVSGTVVVARVVQNQVYLQVEKKKGRQGVKKKLDAPDEAGYQWCQTRGLIVIQTEKYGKVAFLPIGMAQISSVVLQVKQGDCVNKGDFVSYFQFGGSDGVVVFENMVNFDDDLETGQTKLDVRSSIATFE